MQPLLELFSTLKTQFADDEDAIRIIERQVERTQEWIEDNTQAEPEQAARKLGIIEATPESKSARSIFDDIDALDVQKE